MPVLVASKGGGRTEEKPKFSDDDPSISKYPLLAVSITSRILHQDDPVLRLRFKLYFCSSLLSLKPYLAYCLLPLELHQDNRFMMDEHNSTKATKAGTARLQSVPTLPQLTVLQVQPSSNDMNATVTPNNVDAATKPTGFGATSRHRFIVQRAACAVFIRKIPQSVSSEGLKLFVQKRIQLAYKKLNEEIVILSCNIISKGDGSLNQACMEFSNQQMADMALNLRTKSLLGQPLDILAWEDRSPQQKKGTNVDFQPPRRPSVEDQSSVPSSSDNLSGHLSHEGEMKSHQSKKPHAVYVGNLPEGTTADELSKFLVDMFLVAYKEGCIIRRCSMRAEPYNDGYVEFETQEQVNRAIYLRNRTLGGRKISIIGWDYTFKPLNDTKSVESQAVPATATESRDDNSMGKTSSTMETSSVPMATNADQECCLGNTLESSGLASILNKSFFDVNSDRQSSEMPTPTIPSLAHEPSKTSTANGSAQSSLLTQVTSSDKNSATMNAGIAVFRRHLDAARMENQSLKQSIQESAQSIVHLEEIRIDRDEWKASCIDVREKLKKTISELGSCRTAKEKLEEEVTKLKDRLEASLGADESSKKRKSNDSLPIEDSSSSLGDLQTKLADTEKRFKAVTVSLTQQSTTVHETVQENRRLRAMLEKEQTLRIAAEQEIAELRSSWKPTSN
mmetsp:Transcript_49712/g.120503  ORF Transcript_49712/g.120503 Transcript_49712/m.120503 type:complete len:676 (-) Transcript_49712:149-2176(-)